VPFYLRTGKRLSGRRTEIAIHFRAPAHDLFAAVGGGEANVMRLRIDPEHGLATTLSVKRPGPGMRLGPVVTGFSYGDFFTEAAAVGYETLLFDCMTGDSTLFQRADMIEGAWAVVDPLIRAWKDAPVEEYPAGTDGPAAADALLAREGRAWTPLSDA
jgi:glucose-6-phosphate 1-dehydrogenase